MKFALHSRVITFWNIIKDQLESITPPVTRTQKKNIALSSNYFSAENLKHSIVTNQLYTMPIINDKALQYEKETSTKLIYPTNTP